MVASPDVAAVLDEVRDCAKAILAELRESSAVSTGVLYQQLTPDYWTINPLLRSRLRRHGTEMVEGDISVRIVYRGGYVTEGSAVEADVQNLALLTQMEFMRRPHLQSAEYPDGVAAIDPDGLTETAVDVGEIQATEQGRLYGFALTLTCSVLFVMESLEF